MSGYSFEEISAKPFYEFISPKYRETVKKRFKERIQGKNPPTSYIIKVLGKKGREIPIRLRVKRIQYQNRPAALVYIQNLTRDYQLERIIKAISRLNRIKERMFLYSLRELADRIYRIMDETLHLENPYISLRFQNELVEKGNKPEKTLRTERMEIASTSYYPPKLYNIWIENLNTIIDKFFYKKSFENATKSWIHIASGCLRLSKEDDYKKVLNILTQEFLKIPDIKRVEFVIYNKGNIEYLPENSKKKGKTKQYFLIPDTKIERFQDPLKLKKGNRFIIILPLRIFNEIQGIMKVEKDHPFDFIEEKIFALFSHYISLSIFVKRKLKDLTNQLKEKEISTEKMETIISDFSHDLKSELASIYGLIYILKENGEERRELIEEIESKVKEINDKLEISLLVPRVKQFLKQSKVSMEDTFKEIARKQSKNRKFILKIKSKYPLYYPKRIGEVIAQEIFKIMEKNIRAKTVYLKTDKEKNFGVLDVRGRSSRNGMAMQESAYLEALVSLLGGRVIIEEKKNYINIKVLLPE